MTRENENDMKELAQQLAKKLLEQLISKLPEMSLSSLIETINRAESSLPRPKWEPAAKDHQSPDDK